MPSDAMEEYSQDYKKNITKVRKNMDSLLDEDMDELAEKLMQLHQFMKELEGLKKGDILYYKINKVEYGIFKDREDRDVEEKG